MSLIAGRMPFFLQTEAADFFAVFAKIMLSPALAKEKENHIPLTLKTLNRSSWFAADQSP
jgi:hypothetical protein